MPRLLYPAQTAPVRLTDPVTADKWQLLLSEPMRARILAAATIAASWSTTDPSALRAAGLATAANPAMPVMVGTVRRIAYQAMAIPPSRLASAPSEAVTVDKWWRPWAEPAGPMRLQQALLAPAAAGGSALAAMISPIEFAAERILRSPGRRRLLATVGRVRKLP